MSTHVKIAIIGAGSASFSGCIVRDLCVTAGLKGSHIALMDVDGHRLDTVHRIAGRLSDELGAGLSFSSTTDRLDALVV
jgi:alpha-galactosidase